jgi:hypothetical protein
LYRYTEVPHLIRSPAALRSKVQEAIAVLKADGNVAPVTLAAAAATPFTPSAPTTAAAVTPFTPSTPICPAANQSLAEFATFLTEQLPANRLSPDEQRSLLDEALYPQVHRLEPEWAAKITGMLLEMDQSDMLHLIGSPDALRAKVQDAIAVLKAHEAIAALKAADYVAPAAPAAAAAAAASATPETPAAVTELAPCSLYHPPEYVPVHVLGAVVFGGEDSSSSRPTEVTGKMGELEAGLSSLAAARAAAAAARGEGSYRTMAEREIARTAGGSGAAAAAAVAAAAAAGAGMRVTWGLNDEGYGPALIVSSVGLCYKLNPARPNSLKAPGFFTPCLRL